MPVDAVTHPSIEFVFLTTPNFEDQEGTLFGVVFVRPKTPDLPHHVTLQSWWPVATLARLTGRAQLSPLHGAAVPAQYRWRQVLQVTGLEREVFEHAPSTQVTLSASDVGMV